MDVWRRCLVLAWDAFTAGSIPVGAVLTDAEGAVVAEGRKSAVLATVGTIRFAGADPYGGIGALGIANSMTERVGLRIEGPLDDARGALADALIPAFYLRDRPRAPLLGLYDDDALRVARTVIDAPTLDDALTLVAP